MLKNLCYNSMIDTQYCFIFNLICVKCEECTNIKLFQQTKDIFNLLLIRNSQT